MTRIRFLLQLQGLGQVGLSRFAAQHGALLQSAFCLQPNLIKNAQRQVLQMCNFILCSAQITVINFINLTVTFR